MKKYLKEMLPSICLAIVTSFMFFIYEPIIMYASNTSDFWFDIYTLISCNLIAFAISCAAIFIFCNIIYFISKLIFKEKRYLYFGFLVIGFVLFLVTYIQGNYLASKLPVLDGTPIPWNDYTKQSVISAMVLVVISTIAIIMVIKLKFVKTIKIFSFITCAIFVMLSVSMVSTMFTKKDCLERKQYPVTATTYDINKYSKKKNFVIFMIDAVDSETAEKVLADNPDLNEVLKDFTYYPDTMGGYSFTRDSVPLILSGCWNENKTAWATYYNEAMEKSKLIEKLKEKKYNINIYDNEIPYNVGNAWIIKNFSFDNKVDKVAFVKQEIKYDLFKYLPFYAKRISKVETMDYNATRKENSDSESNIFLWDNKVFYNEYSEIGIEKGNENEFKFIHLEGAHVPFDMDKELNEIEGSYEDKIAASFTIFKKYIQKLKDSGVYDNTVIILMADHGWLFDIDDDSLLKRQNPILYIKGLNETHDERVTSDEKVSFEYLQDICNELLDDKKTDTVFENIDNDKPRRYLLQRVWGYDSMEEFYQNGHAKDLTTLEGTGNIYDR